MFLCKRYNDNEASFPRSDGRLSSLPEPIFRYTNRDFWVRTSTFVLINIGYERRKMAATLIPSAIVGYLLLGPSGSFDCFRGVLATTLQCCSFLSGSQSEFFFLVSWARLAADRSRTAVKPCSFLTALSCNFARRRLCVELWALPCACFQVSPRSLPFTASR